MAITILPKTTSGFGEQLGAGLGTGLSQTLSGLAQLKLQEMQQRQQVPALKSLGLPEQLAYLQPQVQQQYVKQLLSAPAQEEFARGLSQILGQPAQLTESIQPTQAQFEQPVVTPEEKNIMPKSIAPKLTQDQAFKLAQLQIQKEKIGAKEKMEAFKLTKAERKDVLEKARAARTNLHDLNRMEELQTTGKLDTPGYVEFLKRSGFDIPSLMNPESQEFQKIAQTFMRDAKSYLGARISNFELDQFLKTIPSLSQSPEGRQRVIAGLKRFSKVSLLYNDAMKKIIRDNKGIPPLNLMEQVDDRIEPQLDKLSKEFKEDLAKPVPAAQNKLVTALQATLGSAIGAPGKLLGKVGGLGGGGPTIAELVTGAF